MLSAMLSNASVVWVGPAIDDVQADFDRRFNRGCSLEGKDLLVASEQERFEEMLRMANEKKFNISLEALQGMSPSDRMMTIFSPGMIGSYQEWRRWHCAKFPGTANVMVDIDHHPAKRGCSGGVDWPTQLTHGHIISLAQEDGDGWILATAKKHFGALGFVMHPVEGSVFGRSPLANVSDALELPAPHLKLLSGNGMHLHTQAAWMMYVLSNIPPRSAPSPRAMSRGSSWDMCDESQEESEGEDSDGEGEEDEDDVRRVVDHLSCWSGPARLHRSR